MNNFFSVMFLMMGSSLMAMDFVQRENYDIEACAMDEKLIYFLMELPCDQKTLIIEQLEIYAHKLAADEKGCQLLFKEIPENIFKVMVRLRYFEQHGKLIDRVQISQFYDQLALAQQRDDGVYDFAELGLTTLDGFIDLLVLSNEVHPVRKIILWWNQISELSKIIALLPQLEDFDVLANQIRVVPDWIGELKQLKRLNLAQNKIARLPESIGSIEHLQGLYITGNYIMQLPESFGNLHELQGLYMKSNPIAQLPASFCRLTELQVLVCEPFLKERLPFEIRDQLRQKIKGVKDYLVRSGHSFVDDQPPLQTIIFTPSLAEQVFFMNQEMPF